MMNMNMNLVVTILCVAAVATIIAAIPSAHNNSDNAAQKLFEDCIDLAKSVVTDETDFKQLLCDWMSEIEARDANPRPNWQEFYNTCNRNYACLSERFDALTEKYNSIVDEIYNISIIFFDDDNEN